MSRWWMCPRSGDMGDWPWDTRRRMAKQVSKIGRPSSRKGTAKEMMVAHLNRPWMEVTASTKPRKVAPVSPMKI